MSKVVQVNIHGQGYAVRSDLDPQYINELAEFLDERMKAAARELSSADPLRVAVIAALNIADELHRARAGSAGPSSSCSCGPRKSSGSWMPSSTRPVQKWSTSEQKRPGLAGICILSTRPGLFCCTIGPSLLCA